MKIALDAMGGDYAPLETTKGALEAIKESNITVVLVGKEEELQKILKDYEYDKSRIEIVNAEEVIEMHEHPAFAVKEKENSSIVKAIKLLKERKVDGAVSAGNTGAVMSSALLYLGRIKGIKRPAISTLIPTLTEVPSIILDIGANVDCKKEYLEQFALMGKIYMEEVFNIKDPKIALLNIGEEEGKGNQLAQETYNLLKNNPIFNFIGNVEGKDLFKGIANVIVCDGFVGNIAIKTAEGVAETLFELLSSEIKSSLWSTILGMLLKPKFKNVKKKLDYSEFGGAPLLGVDGTVIISHGRSKAKAIKNALKLAEKVVKLEINRKILEGLSKITDRGD
ncbi:phosphate acyltransferase PlsX [Dictyoglomus thermophilum]|uniref:Phosphate acyltransferase n=2 Tax=Dictyoglomus thermophilum TaxID=14 RepID=PLSX_DICT6|nr:phosphate acyltransferase PlsX [Dictyoglomus thermophilum]B5YF54.1 RecName: Full=Phosphate acyltransferase; AltName: Full=Acyl-ACP phosphotransacylase; AltName: Full=Acyl-[acyl-carrier-protein]--phosphate acyltransferase; AltName: Full=Phosphate-acyl-ACP acyltransferase [Dictyoglomus thermophilum H-6-12]ACI18358.1 fatty acid/phospholipid synthesis protein PlsX [Dictyoglomus thermophilum H-6-12]TYT22630.1 phosphate acyltransferase PlsX [Dictyoglomus thermophilum]